MKYKAIVEVVYQVYVDNLLGVSSLIAEFNTCKEACMYVSKINDLGLFVKNAYVRHKVVSINNLENIEESAE